MWKNCKAIILSTNNITTIMSANKPLTLEEISSTDKDTERLLELFDSKQNKQMITGEFLKHLEAYNELLASIQPENVPYYKRGKTDPRNDKGFKRFRKKGK